MYFKQFYLGCLAQASYLIGSDGEAGRRRTRGATSTSTSRRREAQGLTIRHVIETHLHADFVSGHRELAERTGAKIYFGAHAPTAEFPHVAREGRRRDRASAGAAASSSRRPATRPSRSRWW